MLVKYIKLLDGKRVGKLMACVMWVKPMIRFFMGFGWMTK